MLHSISVGALGVNCYIIEENHQAIIIDPGSQAKTIYKHLEKMNCEIRAIVLTHGHLDHVGAIAELRDEFIKKPIPIMAHSLDRPYFGKNAKSIHEASFAAFGAIDFFNLMWNEVPELDIELYEGFILPLNDWSIIHSPGHSAGSICLYNKKINELISGDTIFYNGAGRTDGPDANILQLQQSLIKILELPVGTRIFPGHGRETSVGSEKQNFGQLT